MRIWLDSMGLNRLQEEAAEVLENLIENNHTLIIANTAIDVRCFQEDPDWLEDHLEDGNISIEIWDTPDEMVAKPFFWSSAQKETPASENLEDAIIELDNEDAILDIADLVYEYGVPNGEWYQGEFSPDKLLSDEIASGIGIVESDTRSNVLEAAIIADRIDLFDKYYNEYVKGLANQHMCDAYLNFDGSIIKI